MRLKVLISAYACEPGKGSEPDVGWQWVLQMARFHDVTVLTRANNQPTIEPALEQLKDKQPLPQFVYHDCGETLLDIKKRFRAATVYYLLWQRSARDVIQRLHQIRQFDLMHHVTFAAFRYPVAIWGHGVPSIWGPVGGVESIPLTLLPWGHPVSLVRESVRNVHNLLQTAPYHVLPRRARASTLILASTREMQRTFARLGFETQLMPTIGLKTAELPYRPRSPAPGPLRMLYVGDLITLKGINLAIKALKQSGIDATFTLVGRGNYQPTCEAQAAALGMKERVKFLGRLPREQVLRLYAEHDLLVFPSLHDTGGYAVIEAMCNELPVICLACGGPAVAVKEECGIRVPLGPRAEVVKNLAAAMKWYDQNRAALSVHGKAARSAVLQNYDWERKGEEMNRCYETAMNRAKSGQAADSEYSGMGAMTNILHRVFSFRGLFLSVAGLLLSSATGFSLGRFN